MLCNILPVKVAQWYAVQEGPDPAHIALPGVGDDASIYHIASEPGQKIFAKNK